MFNKCIPGTIIIFNDGKAEDTYLVLEQEKLFLKLKVLHSTDKFVHKGELSTYNKIIIETWSGINLATFLFP